MLKPRWKKVNAKKIQKWASYYPSLKKMTISCKESGNLPGFDRISECNCTTYKTHHYYCLVKFKKQNQIVFSSYVHLSQDEHNHDHQITYGEPCIETRRQFVDWNVFSWEVILHLFTSFQFQFCKEVDIPLDQKKFSPRQVL
jgi:hypothetical protein